MIHLTKITKQFGSKTLFKDASLTVNPGERIGLVGPNGAGKTSIFRLIVGEEGIDSGHVSVPDRCVVGYFSQDVGEMEGRTVLEEVKTAAGDLPALSVQLKEIEAKLEDSAINPIDDDVMQKLLDTYGEAQSKFERLGGYDLDSRAQEILTGLGFPPDEHERPTESYSGGWKMRIALAKILLLNPDVLLMDEPTNHLDVESIIWLESWLMQYKGALLMTSHDREFMNRLVTKIVEISNKEITAYSGNYDFYEKERELRRAQLRAAHERQNDMLAKEEEFIARFAARASHAAQVQSRVKKLEKIERIELPPEEAFMKFQFPVPPRGGDEVVRFENLSKIWPAWQEGAQEKKVFSGATATVKRLDRVAVVGVNGAGKSTLLKMITGGAEPTNGLLQVGPSTKIGYFSQSSLEVLNPRNTILEEVHSRIPNSTIASVRNLLGAFRFSGDQVEKKVSVLSGGEKSRLVLATMLVHPVNFLVLDEPTNHLDIGSREVLLDALKEFQGTVMLVSHDRFFLKQLVNRVFELDRHELRIYEGDYDYYLWKRDQDKA